MKSCVVYKSDKELIFVTQYVTDIGIVMNGNPIFRVPLVANEEYVEQKLAICLEASKIDVPRPPIEELKLIAKNNLKSMGFSSYPSLYKNTKSSKIELSNEGYKVTPYGYFDDNNPSKGLKPLNSEALFIEEKDEVNQIDMEKILIEIIDNKLHEDLILKIQSIDFTVIADSHYYLLDPSFSEIVKVDKGFAMAKMLNEWMTKVEALGRGDICFLPFDFSDQYIGCLRFESLDEDNIQGQYGITQKILGMMISPSKLEQFDIDDSDFEVDSGAFFMSKSEFISSIEDSLGRLKYM